jgi:molybdopterin-binding protein
VNKNSGTRITGELVGSLYDRGRGTLIRGDSVPRPRGESRSHMCRVAGIGGCHDPALSSSGERADPVVTGSVVPDDGAMKFSTRNQLPGTVVSVTLGEAMAVVRIQLDNGPLLTSSITRDAAEDLALT